MKKITTQSATETKKVAMHYATKIMGQKLGSSAVVLALEGDLGAGKTTFIQGFTQGLGIKETVNSPTFVIMKKFKIPNSKFSHFYHFDCYRLDKAKEILSLGFKEIISDPHNIVAIEWSEKIKKLLPKNSIKMQFNHFENNKREITVF